MASSNIDISKFLPTDTLAAARRAVERKCSDPLLLTMLEDGLHADITLKAKGGTVRAHRTVLASASPVFRAMFQHDMKEQLTSSVDLLDMTIRSLQLFFLLLYITNERTCAIPEFDDAVDKHFDDLYDAAQKFQVGTRLQLVLMAGLARNLHPSNCWDYYHKSVGSLLSKYVDPGADSVCMDYILDNFNEVMKSKSTLLEMGRDLELVHSCMILATNEGSCCAKCKGSQKDSPKKTPLKRKNCKMHERN